MTCNTTEGTVAIRVCIKGEIFGHGVCSIYYKRGIARGEVYVWYGGAQDVS